MHPLLHYLGSCVPLTEPKKKSFTRYTLEVLTSPSVFESFVFTWYAFMALYVLSFNEKRLRTWDYVLMCPNWPICVSKLLILCTWQKKNLIFMCALSAIYIGEVKHTLMGGANESTGAHPFFLWSWGVFFPLFSYLQDLL